MAAEYLGGSLARAKEVDCLDARRCRAGSAMPPETERLMRWNYLLLARLWFLPDAFFHGAEPLPSEHIAR